jgi:hypothetical protein
MKYMAVVPTSWMHTGPWWLNVNQEVTTPYTPAEQLILYPHILFEIKNLICKQLVFEDKTQEETLHNHQITSYLSYTETKT